MSFTNGKPFVVNAEQVAAKWNGRKETGFCCTLCGHTFKEGDTARFIYNPGPGANFMVCQPCDGPDVLQRGIASFDLARKLAKQWGIYGPDWQE